MVVPDSFPALRAIHAVTAARDLGLTGGDDYELCFTLPYLTLPAAALIAYEAVFQGGAGANFVDVPELSRFRGF